MQSPVQTPADSAPWTWDVLCRVVDNFGDAGFAWRLANRLHAHTGQPVRLWVDGWETLAQLVPGLSLSPTPQTLQGITLLPWPDAAPALLLTVVVETFGCGLPPGWADAMQAQPQVPVWVNLEYLSAEDWVAGCHRLSSRQPQWALTQHFFFPGFTAETGGLLREPGLLDARDAFQANPQARTNFLQTLGWQTDDGPALSLFCYLNPALPEWLHCLSQGPRRCLLVTPGLAARQIAEQRGQPFPPGTRLQQGALTLIALPFLRQGDYDRLLWACELNLVRGEESLVRAQWSGRPFVWQVYPTADGAHQPKLASLLQRLSHSCSPGAAGALERFHQAWNQTDNSPLPPAWADFDTALPGVAQGMAHWCAQLARQPDLACQLAQFVFSKL